MPQRTPPDSLPWSNIRWMTAFFGFVSLILGQCQIAGYGFKAGTSSPAGDWLNTNLHLGITDINNVLFGLPVLLLGAALLVLSLRGSGFLSSNAKAAFDRRPPDYGIIKKWWPVLLGAALILIFLLVQLSQLKYGVSSIILWLIPPVLVAVFALFWDRRRGIDLSPHLSRRDLIWIMVILLGGFLIGAYRLQGWPDQLIGDEGNFWTIARDIANGTFHPAIFASGVYSFPILSSYLQAAIMKVFGVTLWGWRMASVLPGLVTVIPLYLLARDAFNKRIAIASSIVLVTSAYFLSFSRLGYNNIQALPVTAFALYWLYNGLKKASHFLLILSGLAVGLGFYTYFGARGTAFVCVLFIAILWMTRKIKTGPAFKSLLLVSLAAALVSLPYFVYGMHQDAGSMSFKTFESVFFNVFNGRQFFTDAQLFKYAPVIHMGGNDLFFNPPIYLILFFQGLLRTLIAFQKPWLITEHYIASPLAGTITVIFYLFGLGMAIWKMKEPRQQLLLAWFFTFVIGFSALNTVPPRHTHMVALIPVLAIFIAIGMETATQAITSYIAWLGERLRLRRSKKTGWLDSDFAQAEKAASGTKTRKLLFAGLLVLVGLSGLYDYFVLAPHKYHPQPDQVMSWAALDSTNQSFIYIYQDPAQKDFHPYIINEFRKSVPFQSFAIQDFLNGKSVLGDHTIVFYPPELTGEVDRFLKAEWGEELILQRFFSTDGTPVLSAGMITPFTFERDRSLASTFADAFLHKRFDAALILCLAFLLLSIFLPASIPVRLPRVFRRLINWFFQPMPVIIEEELQPDELAIQLASGDPPAMETDQLPAWVDQFETLKEDQKANRPKSEFRSVKSDSGRELFIHIHLPRFHLGKRNLPREISMAVPPIQFPNGLLLIAAIFLAFTAQFALSRQWYIPGAILYAACATGLFLWARRNPKWVGLFTGQVRFSPRLEIILAVILLLTVTFTRFYDLQYRVYGLEADETKWTVQSWYSTILRVDQGEFATAHYKYLPVSFWVRSVFLRLFGMNFISARIESAFLSVLSALFLYLLVRRLTKSPPMALLSTLLYSFSFVELNESHQALHDTTVEFWMVCGLYLLILAIQQRKWWQFQLAGIVLGLGMLTYETFFATPVVAAVFLVVFGSVQVIRKRDSAVGWLKSILLFLWPIAFLYILYIHGYIASQRGQFSNLEQFSSHGSNLAGLFHFMLRNSGDLLKTFFVRVVWTDSLINWAGPFINPWLIVFVVIGFVFNLINIRKPFFVFIPLWFLINILYAPILVGAVWPRILYTTLAPIAIWGAMGLWTFLAALRSWFDGLKLKLSMPIFAFLICLIVVNDYHIFTSSLLDPLDRQKRRELATLTAQSSAAVPMLLFPYEPNQNDSVYVESHVLLFSVASGHKAGLDAANYYKQVPFDQTMVELYQNRQTNGLNLVFDKTATNLIDERNQTLRVILKCYPAAYLSKAGQFFDVYHFDPLTLSQPACYQTEPPMGTAPLNGEIVSSSSPINLQWDAKGTTFKVFSIQLDRKNDNTYWLEAEQFFSGPDWYGSAEFVNGFTGTGFLMDNWNAGTAQYTLPIQQAGKYNIWVRSYKREQNDQSNFLAVNGMQTQFAKNSNALNAWVWENVGTFDLPAGPLPLALSRAYGQDPQYSVFIDTLLITPDLNHSPASINIWQTVVDTGQIHASRNNYVVDRELTPGEYRWKVRVFDGDLLIDTSGNKGVETPFSTFFIQNP